jgi:hypothetical protein
MLSSINPYSVTALSAIAAPDAAIAETVTSHDFFKLVLRQRWDTRQLKLLAR